MIKQDKGIVIYDKDNEEYYCEFNKWDKQLRKAKIYHSERYACDAHNKILKTRPNTTLLYVEIKVLVD